MRVPLFGLGQVGKSVTVTAQQRSNCYVEISKEADKSQITLYRRSGLDLFDSFGDTPVRGALELGDFNYVVHRGTFWEQNNSGVKVNRGSLLTSAGLVSIACDGNTIQIVDGQYSYVYNTTTQVFTQTVSVNYVPGVTNAWIDGYFITDRRGSTNKTEHNRYAWSLDGITYSALNFNSASASYDKIQRVYADNRQLVLFGEVTTEFHNNTGNLDLPFTRTASNEWGLAAVMSVAKINASVIFLGQNRMGKTQVMVLNGYSPQIVSTPEMSAVIDSYGNVSNAVGRSSMEAGHPFYYLTFPSVGKTWLFDADTALWQLVTSGLTESQYRGLISNNYLGRTLVYDYANGNVYQENPLSYTDNGDSIVVEVTSRHLFSENLIGLGRLWIDMETGVGLATGQGSNPLVMLRISKDGGFTYPIERTASIGAIGKYKQRPYFNRVCLSRDCVLKVRITDPVKVVIVGAYLDNSVGENG